MRGRKIRNDYNVGNQISIHSICLSALSHDLVTNWSVPYVTFVGYDTLTALLGSYENLGKA